MSTKASEMEDDCLGCRITGSVTLLGVGTYFFNERSKLPRHDLGQRRWLLACAGTFVAAGVWRATTHLFDSPTHSLINDTPTSLNAQPWYSCEGYSQQARAWFGMNEKPTRGQHHADDK